ncbi:MAG: DUF1329 domain-containing protein [Burkholderiales bacterium]|nr:DUF1329 domain-containing protein [Burkholderiales bacterium]
MNLNRHFLAAAGLAALMSSGAAYAGASAADIAKLGNELTPTGAEKAGSADGVIPAWTGGLASPPAGYVAGKGYIDPFAAEKPKFTITKANAAQYKAQLPAGAQALLEKIGTFKMNVYPTHRTAALPKAITDKVKEQAAKVELQGFGLANVGGTTTPFPFPKNGLEVMWNHNIRYLGGGIDRIYDSFPVRANGDTFDIRAQEVRVFAQNMDKSEPNRLLYYMNTLLAPAALVGSVVLVHEPLDQVKEARSAWVYNAGQRRVRRAPDLAYDSITDGTEGMRYTDQYDGYNGAPDRFDFKLVGKKEMIVPYNDYKLMEKSTKYADVTKPGTPNPDLIRYETHRVWVVDATLKPGQKHAFARRTFYVDEDSWSVLWEDAYDSRGNLWRVGVHPVMQFYDADVMWYSANIWHDLSNGGYFIASLGSQEPQWKFNVKGKLADFEPDALRRAGTR